jgi:hypothetical protein
VRNAPANIASAPGGRLAAALVLAAAGAGCATGSSASTAPPPRSAADRAVIAPGAVVDVPLERKPWRYGGQAGQVIFSPHYCLYTTLNQEAELERLPQFMERALTHYTSALAPLPMPRARLETYLFETRNQWEAKTRQMLPDQAGTFLTLGRGGFTTRGTSVLYYIGRADTLAITAHEGWHQYSQRVLGNQIPLWLEEGIATYMEGYVSYPDGVPKFRPWANLERYHTLRRAAQADRLIPLVELLRRAPQSFLTDGKARLLVYYAQVWALVHFLAEGEDARYRGALRRLLVDAARGRLAGRAGGGRLGPGVLAAYVDSDLEAFERRYLDFVHDIVQRGGRSRIVRGRSPLED